MVRKSKDKKAKRQQLGETEDYSVKIKEMTGDK